MTLQHAKILNANLVVNLKKVSSTLMVNASSLYRVHAFMLVKVTKLVKLSTLNVKTAFVMLIVLSAVLINRARSFDQFSENPRPMFRQCSANDCIGFFEQNIVKKPRLILK